MNEDSPLMGPKDAARFLRLNEQTVRRLAREGRLPAARIGGSWRFNQEELSHWSARAPSTAPAATPAPASSAPARHILIVDDEEAALTIVKRTLERHGFQVTTAGGGVEALQKISEKLPDLVLLDLFMDDMNGTDVLAHIRTEWGYLPVAIMTARPDSDLMQKALMLSPVLLLAKPFSQAQLMAAVRQALPSAAPAKA